MSFLTVAAHAAPAQEAPRLVYVKLAPAAVREAINPVGSIGKVVARDAKAGVLTVRVKPGMTLAEAVRRLEARREVASVWAKGIPAANLARGTGSVTFLQDSIRELKERAGEDPDHEEHERQERLERQRRGEKATGPENAEEESVTEYLESLLWTIKQRAYPYDRIDTQAYDRAANQVRRMVPTTLIRKRPIQARVAGLSEGWQFVGPKDLNTPYVTYYGVRPSSGRVNAIAYDPSNTRTIYAGAPQGGVMKSTDGGVNWTPLGDTWQYNTVNAIAIDPAKPTTIYAGSGDFQGSLPAYTLGIMKSTDGGATWTNYGRAQFGNSAVSQIVVDPETPSTVIVATGRGPRGNGNVWRSTDGGVNWTQVTPAGNFSGLTIGAKASDGKRSYYAASDAGVYRSDDRGATWTKLTTPASSDYYTPLDIAGSAVDSKTAYLLSTRDKKIYKTTDSGANWTDVSGSFPNGDGDYNWSQGFYDYHIHCFAKGGQDDIVVGLIDVVESPDGGSSWKSIGQTYTNQAITHNDQHSFAANPTNPDEILIGNDGGLYKGTRSGTAWSINGLSTNLGITQFYNAAFHPTDLTRILGGTQDNASPVSLGNLSRWENVGGGDGGFCAINPFDPNIQYVTIYGLTVIQTRNNWSTSADISPDTGSEPTPFVSPIFQDPTNKNYLYGCTDHLWRYDLSTNGWTGDLGGIRLSRGGLINYVAVAPSNGQVIFTGSEDGQLYLSMNGGGSFRIISSGLPNRGIKWISVNPTNPNDVLVAFAGTGTAHLYRSTNATSAGPTWTSVSGTGSAGLLDVNTNTVVRDPRSPANTWYVGNDLGVFSTSDAGVTWQNATNPAGLPNVQVNTLGFTTVSVNGVPTTYLQAATFGRGIWRAKLSTETGALVPTGIVRIPNYGLPVGSASVLASDTDGRAVTINSVSNPGLGQLAGAGVEYTIPDGTLAGFSGTFTLSATRNVTAQIYLKNQVTGELEFVSANPVSTKKTTLGFSLTSNAANYMTADRKVVIVVRGLNPQRIGGMFRLLIDKSTLNAGL